MSLYVLQENMSRSSPQLVALLKDVRDGRVECNDARRNIFSEPVIDFPNAGEVLSFLNHYLDDGDIRRRDEGYRTMQDDELDKLIGRLEHSDYEAASKITFLHASRSVKP